MRPTFSGFYVARQGLDAARMHLEVTGQNITNADSKGYSRQRVDTYARGSGAHNMRYAPCDNAYVGEGVQVRGVSQLRDPCLDVRYRRENAKLGSASAQSEGLTDLGYIFDNAVEKGFNQQFSDLVTQLQSLAKKPTDPVSENIVKTSATMLLQMFHQSADQINVVKEQQIILLRDGAIKNSNECLSSIAKLNKEIRSANISGNPALELLDERNLLIDQLSKYVNIETATKRVGIGEGIEVEELSINLIASNGEKVNLVDNEKFTEFEFLQNLNGDVSIRLLNDNGKPVDSSITGRLDFVDGDITDQLVTGAFHGYLKILNAKGEFGNPPTQDKGIAYYEGMLNSLAKEFASAMNTANSTATQNKPLFVSNDGKEINSKNISISEEWKNAKNNYITSTKKPPQPGMDNSDDSENILHMISLFSSKQECKAGSNVVFNGTFQECVTHISATLGLGIKDITRQSKTFNISLTDINKQRMSVSAVNVDEEGINLIMYNQALTASSRLMTTLDEAVDVIINRMGIVGR